MVSGCQCNSAFSTRELHKYVFNLWETLVLKVYLNTNQQRVSFSLRDYLHIFHHCKKMQDRNVKVQTEQQNLTTFTLIWIISCAHLIPVTNKVLNILSTFCTFVKMVSEYWPTVLYCWHTYCIFKKKKYYPTLLPQCTCAHSQEQLQCQLSMLKAIYTGAGKKKTKNAYIFVLGVFKDWKVLGFWIKCLKLL